MWNSTIRITEIPQIKIWCTARVGKTILNLEEITVISG